MLGHQATLEDAARKLEGEVSLVSAAHDMVDAVRSALFNTWHLPRRYLHLFICIPGSDDWFS
jgi:hypothetical protein